MFRFIHAVDIHLDSPLEGLERYEGSPVEEIGGATRRAFENRVRLAIDEEVDFVLIAGDLYDGEWRDVCDCRSEMGNPCQIRYPDSMRLREICTRGFPAKLKPWFTRIDHRTDLHAQDASCS